MVQFGDAITATTGLNTTLWKKCPRHSMDGTHTYIDTSNHCRLISALGPAYEAYPSSISFDVLATGSVNVRADALQSSGFHVFLLTWWPLGPLWLTVFTPCHRQFLLTVFLGLLLQQAFHTLTWMAWSPILYLILSTY